MGFLEGYGKRMLIDFFTVFQNQNEILA